jgi:hypothetical protein
MTRVQINTRPRLQHRLASTNRVRHHIADKCGRNALTTMIGMNNQLRHWSNRSIVSKRRPSSYVADHPVVEVLADVSGATVHKRRNRSSRKMADTVRFAIREPDDRVNVPGLCRTSDPQRSNGRHDESFP